MIIVAETRNGSYFPYSAFICNDEADFISRIAETQIQARSDEETVTTVEQAINYLNERHAQSTKIITESDYKAGGDWPSIVKDLAVGFGWESLPDPKEPLPEWPTDYKY